LSSHVAAPATCDDGVVGPVGFVGFVGQMLTGRANMASIWATSNGRAMR
ncbi:MAG: hypothetical protein JWN39_179, partial [Ilumatobacteraceae bacterium]|nr:hypothetical protein [Ilumatobacteraceae bacterium]